MKTTPHIPLFDLRLSLFVQLNSRLQADDLSLVDQSAPRRRLCLKDAHFGFNVSVPVSVSVSVFVCLDPHGARVSHR